MSTTRTAVITGAGSERGIGRETALHLADAGFAVAVLDIDGEAAERTAAAAGERGAVPALAWPPTSPTPPRSGGPSASSSPPTCRRSPLW
ncbi:SDR family NAD(P)-dependent oxidoreductase [Saccharopolyspora erythraea]|uniref:SDR family NAD(P)-dependent oxidoreductase n=1 Tax=Saccharopolyspora erythraea TaxID=1836 RepID=UPI0001D30E99|nr:SDR family NAD(P)-dependent oxidoreductase [Saccharopolyspora erythraea]